MGLRSSDLIHVSHVMHEMVWHDACDVIAQEASPNQSRHACVHMSGSLTSNCLSERHLLGELCQQHATQDNSSVSMKDTSNRMM